MPLRNRLALYAYNPATGTITNYGDQVTDISFTTVAPGGWGDLKCTLVVPESRIVPPELTAFSKVALVDGPFACFQGRWDQPEIQVDPQGTTFNLSAMGASHTLTDDPDDYAYSGKTANYIISDQFTKRGARLQLDTDQSLVLPDAPAATYTETWNGKNFDEILNDLATTLAATAGNYTTNYQWLVWDHYRNRDSAGFPTWQLQYHRRDTSTISYAATSADIQSLKITPAVEYSYNAVKILFRDSGNSNAANAVTVTDSRLGAGGAQGTAPFPWRLLRKDISSVSLTSTEATAIANALLSQYQNGGFKISLELTSVNDAYGNPIPLHQVRADTNIFLPEYATIGTTLPTTPTANVNVFYVTETSYQESAGQTPVLTITASAYSDTVEFQLARLQYIADHNNADQKAQQNLLAAGATQTGTVSLSWGANAVNTDVYETSVNFPKEFSNQPTISLSLAAGSNYSGSYSIATYSTRGFSVRQGSGTGAGYTRYTWTATG